LGNTYGESVEKEIEIKLAEHERRGIERNADSAKQDREQYGDIARRFVFEKIHNRKLFHVCLLYTEIIMFLGKLVYTPFIRAIYLNFYKATSELFPRTRHVGVSFTKIVKTIKTSIAGERRHTPKIICQSPIHQYQKTSKMTPTP